MTASRAGQPLGNMSFLGSISRAQYADFLEAHPTGLALRTPENESAPSREREQAGWFGASSAEKNRSDTSCNFGT